MINALLLIARWIGQAHDRWRTRAARRRALAAQVDTLREEIKKLANLLRLRQGFGRPCGLVDGSR
jgi:hypothetical protein